MDEKSALKRTTATATATATKDQEWKKKKGYSRILVAVPLALLLSLYAGGYLGSSTNLHHGEMGTKDAAASSSSTSLMGSGKSAAHCKKNTGYNCGAVFPPDGNTCSQKGCCCSFEDGTGYKLNTCDNAKGYAYRGCNSCWGKDACFKTNNINVGTSSCSGQKSCREVSDSTIANDSCHGNNACKFVQNSIIHDGSCHGLNTCEAVKNSIIGKGSCTGPRYNDDYDYSCGGLENITIGNNSCNGGSVYKRGLCYQCKHNVPDNACNEGITDDMDIHGNCNYCL